MWSYSYTSTRSRFPEAARVGYHATGLSEGATAEGVRLAITKAKVCLVVVDPTAVVSVATALKEAPRPMLVLRLTRECHRNDELKKALDLLNSVDGVLVPWHDLFLETWQRLQDVVASGKVKWLGTDNFEISQLERAMELHTPAVNLISVSLENQRKRLLTWCHGRAIDVLGMLPPPDNLPEDLHQSRPGVEPSLLLTRWAVQTGVIALPNYDAWLTKGASLKNADDYGLWLSAFADALNLQTKHLHSPSELRRVQLPNDALTSLLKLDPSAIRPSVFPPGIPPSSSNSEE